MTRDFGRCPRCSEYGWLPHTCAPLWEARIDDKHHPDWMTVRAHSAEDAATKFAEAYDCDGADYCILQSGSETVLVRRHGEDQETRFEISAESVPKYYAHLADEQPIPNTGSQP